MKSNITNKVRIQLARWIHPTGLSLIVALATLASVDMAQAAVRMESDGGPFYARIQANFVATDGETAAIVFYRDPACVPGDFNLLAFFDPTPAPPPYFLRPFQCHSYVAAFGIIGNGPSPIFTQLRGIEPVPIWFVSWAELEAAMADGVLTVGDLASLPSLLVGHATFYNDTQHPGVTQCHSSVEALGYLEDGRPFQYQMVEWNNTITHIRIHFSNPLQ